MPNGTFVPEAEREDQLRSGDYEFESAQENYLMGELSATDEDCKALVHAIDEARWDDSDDLFGIIVGRLDDMHLGERVTRRKFDPLCDEFQETLDFIQTVEFGSLWVPEKTDC
jgi:hypothetical protein